MAFHGYKNKNRESAVKPFPYSLQDKDYLVHLIR